MDGGSVLILAEGRGGQVLVEGGSRHVVHVLVHGRGGQVLVEVGSCHVVQVLVDGWGSQFGQVLVNGRGGHANAAAVEQCEVSRLQRHSAFDIRSHDDE